MESLNLVVVVLLPFERKCHTIPHLKAPTSSTEHASGQGRGSTLYKGKTAISCNRRIICI